MNRLIGCVLALFILLTSAHADNFTNAENATTTITGKLRTSSTSLPDGINILAYRIDGNMTNGFSGEVSGEVHGDSFQITLSPGKYLVCAKAPEWKTIGHLVVVPTSVTSIELVLFPEHGSNKALSEELEKMQAADQDARMRWIQSNAQAHGQEVSEVDAKNRTRLREIIKENGWPSAGQVGLNGVNAVWLMIQHAPEFIKEYLPYMKASAENNEIPWSTVALSIDRDLIHDEKKQLYGSQAKLVDGKVELLPVEDESHLDERRAKLGMDSIEEYKKGLLKMYTPKPVTN